MESKGVTLVAALLLTTAGELQAQCAGSDNPNPLFASDKIQLVASGFSGSLSNVVSMGMAKWNKSDCNSGGDDFPHFQTVSTGASRVITVTYRSGLNPDNNYSCGNFGGNLINIYSLAKNPANGSTVSCGNADRLAESLAHELGHLLGLSDQYASGCQGVIMSQVAMTSAGQIQARNVSAAECQKANEMNLTTPEEPPPVDDPYCDAYCWTSCANNQCPLEHPGCPLILDLDRGGIHLTGLGQPVYFDIDADGSPEMMAWTTEGAGDGFLALDRNGNGLIDDGSELFGNATLLSEGSLAANGYLALADYDEIANGGNADGQMSAEDLIFGGLLLWIDSNHNGDSEASELVLLADAGVTRINLDYRRSNRSDLHGNEFRFRGLAWKLGPAGVERAIQTWDVFFRLGD